MKKTALFVSAFLLVAATAFAQGRGGGRPAGGQGQGSGQGQQQGQQQGQANPQAARGGQQTVKATKQQRDQIQACSKQADNLGKQIRKMSQTQPNKFSGNEARKQRDLIQAQLKAMEQEHERLMNGLDPAQQQVWQEQLRNLNRLRQEARTRYENMNSELNAGNPDAARVTERAREMEQTMKEMSKQYQALHAQTQP